MNNFNIEKRNITVKEAARLMGKHEMFVRIGLQNGTLPFGVAEKLPNRTKYTYHISPKLFYEYLGTSGLQSENNVILYKGYEPTCRKEGA